MQSTYHFLKKHWNYNSFRSPQEAIIDAVLSDENVLAILPTGGGKSLCYQLPSLMKGGTTLVISPLIALMNDQVRSLNTRNIPATALHAGFTQSEIHNLLENAVNGKYKLLYISPERLHSPLFLEYAADIEWSFLAIDEAHCISQWGHDFRPLYREIPALFEIATFQNIIALTASATPRVKEDIIEQLQMKNVIRFEDSIIRDNLFYEVQGVSHKANPLIELISTETTIVYCPTRKLTEETNDFLKQHQITSFAFHAGLSINEKDHAQNTWMQSDTTTICATSAFGMGIDKPDVRTVIHYAPPQSLEAYYQEAGRAGRDGQYAKAITLYTDRDIEDLVKSTGYKFPAFEIIKATYETIMNHLQIATGEGAENLYFLDPIRLAQQQKIPILQFLSAIKILEQNKYCVWNMDDQSFHHVKFEADRSELSALRITYPSLHSFAIELLRMYGGIMDYKTKVDLVQIAQFTQANYEQIKRQLQDLHQAGVIRYYPAQKGSSLFLLENRLPSATFYIDKKKFFFLKDIYEKQIQAMIQYLEDDENCRNVLLARYFGESNVQDCKHCDNCKQKYLESNPVDLQSGIRDMIQLKESISITDLFKTFPEYNQKTILQHVQTLAQEQIVKIQGTNIIFAP